MAESIKNNDVSDNKVTEAQPPYPNTPTHKIKVETKLALRTHPSAVKVSEAVDEDETDKGNLLKMLDNGTRVIVIDEATGYNCEWMEVIVEGFVDERPSAWGDRTFIYSGRDENGEPKFVKKLSSTPKSANFKYSDKAIPNPNASTAWTNWSKKPVFKSWYEPKTACHYVSVETEYTSTGGAQVTQRMSEAIDVGLAMILSDNNKKGARFDEDKAIREDLQNSFIFARATKWSLETRPTVTKLKILVELPHKYLDAIDDEDGDGVTEIDDVSPADLGLRYSMKFTTSTMRKEIETLQRILRKYGEDINNFEGTVKNWDGEVEAQPFDNFMQSTKKLFKANGIEIDETADDKFEVGMNEKYEPKYAQVYSEKDMTTTPFTKGLPAYGREPPLDEIRSAAFLYLRHEITAADHRSMPWTDFITTYTFPKPDGTPTITTTASGKGSDADTSERPKAGKKIRDAMNRRPIKAESQKSAEDKQLKNESLRTDIAKERENNSDNVGDAILQDLQGALNCVQNAPSDLQLEAAFECILNKIPIQELIMQALGCLMPQLSELEGMWDKLGDHYYAAISESKALYEDLEKMFVDEVVNFEFPDPPSMRFFDDLPTTDIMGSLTDAIKAALIDVLKQAFVSMIVGVLEGLVLECEDAAGADDFGAQNINDALDSARNPDGSVTTRPQMDDRLKELSDAFGINFPDAETIRNMLADVSSILTPSELCLLLVGTPSQNIIMLVKSLLNSRYPISNRGWTNTKVIRLFKALGKMIDPMYCEQILNPDNELLGFTDSFCDEFGLVEEVRRGLYERKGDMSDDQIDEALRKIKDRKKEKAVALIEALTDPNNNAGIPLIGPNLFCSPSNPGGIFKTEHPSVTWMRDTLMDTMMHGPYIAFAEDARDFPEMLISDEMVTEEVPTTFVPKGPDGQPAETDNALWRLDTTEEPPWDSEVDDGVPNGHMVNPALNSMGFANINVKEAWAMGKPSIINGVDFRVIKAHQKKKSVAPHIRSALEEIETNEVFSMSRWPDDRPMFGEGLFSDFFDNAWVYEFTLPRSPSVNTTLNMFANQEFPEDFFNSFKDAFTGNVVRPETIAEAANMVNPNWKIFYALPIAATRIDAEAIETMIEEMLNAARAISILNADTDSCAIFDCDAELEIISEHISQPAPDGFGLDQSTFSLSCDSPHFNFVGLEREATMDDEYALAVVMNPDSSTPHTVISIYGNEAIAEDIKKMIDEIQFAVGTNIKNVVDVSPPQQMLADLVKFKWAVKAPLNRNASIPTLDYAETSGLSVSLLSSSAQIDSALSRLTSYYKFDMFEYLSVDIIKYLARKIAESPYFKTFDHKVNIAGQIQTSQTPLIRMLNLAPMPTKEQHDCGIDPHLLRCGEAKQEIADETKKQGGNCPVAGPASLDGLGSEGGPFQDALCQAVVRLLVRSYVIDYLLRGIFPLSAFAPSRETDNVLVEYFAALIKMNLKLYGPDIASQVEDVADNLYMTAFDHPGVYHPEPGEKLGKGLKWLVREEYLSVARDCAAMIGTSLSGDVDTSFLKRLSKFEVGVPTGPVSSEFAGGAVTPWETVSWLEDRLLEERFGESNSFDTRNGEIFMERYWRVWAKTKNGIPDITEVGNQEIQTCLIKHMKKWGWKDALTSSGSLRTEDHLQSENSLNLSEDSLGFGNSRGEQECGGISSGNAGSGVISSKELNALMVDMGNSVGGGVKLSDLFDDVKYGHRIMHLAPPTNHFQNVGALVRPMDPIFGVFSHAIDYKFFILERSHEIFEFKYVETPFTLNGEALPAAGVNLMPAVASARPLYITPLCSYEDNVLFDINDSGVDDTPAMEVPASDALWENNQTYTMTNFYDAMASTPEYRLIFDYIFPLDRFVTLLTVFTIQGVSSMRNVDIAFDNTRDEILRLFKTCHNTADYTYIDENILCVGLDPGISAAIEKISGDGGVLANCLPEFELPDICFGMKGLGLAFPIKMAIKTPLIILKALIELMDPLIGLAKMLHIALKLLGVCLPIPALGFMQLPINIFMPPPIGIGIGPPLTMMGMVYMALGFGMLDLSFMEDGMLGLELDFGEGSDFGFAFKPDSDTKACTSSRYEFEAGFKAKKRSKDPMPKSSTEMTMEQLINNLYTEPSP